MTNSEENFSTEELCNLSGYTKQHLYRLVEQGHVPTPQHGRWPLATLKALFTYLRGQVKQQSSGQLAEARLRSESARADMLEERVARSRGELLLADEVREGWESLVLSFRTKLMAIPARLAGQLMYQKSQAEMEAILLKNLREALEELAKPTDFDAVDDPQATRQAR